MATVHIHIHSRDVIAKTGSGYQVRSEGGKNLSSANLSKAAAHKRLAEVEWFKAHPNHDEFKESEHPRDPDGEFRNKGSAPKAGATTFFSPNVKEGTNVRQGARRLGSMEHQAYHDLARRVDHAVGIAGHARAAIGAWADGGEDSIVTTYAKNADYESVRAATAMKGLLAQQKGVITFKSEDGGKSRMHTLTGVSIKSPQKLSTALVKAGIPYHTLVQREGGGFDVHVFEEDATDEMDHNVATFASAIGAKVSAQAGIGTMLGSWDSRSEGRAQYESVINDYIKQHPAVGPRWQELLASHKFRKAKDSIMPNQKPAKTKDDDSDDQKLAAALKQCKATPFKPKGYQRQVPIVRGDGSIKTFSKG